MHEEVIKRLQRDYKKELDWAERERHEAARLKVQADYAESNAQLSEKRAEGARLAILALGGTLEENEVVQTSIMHTDPTDGTVTLTNLTAEEAAEHDRVMQADAMAA